MRASQVDLVEVELYVKVTPAESLALKEWAREQGVNLSSFCRGMLLTALVNYRSDRLKMFQAKEKQRKRVGS